MTNQGYLESVPTMMERLKAATRADHAALEAQVNLPHLVASLATYHTLLQRFYGFYLPLEARLVVLPWAAAAFDWAPRRKTPLLTQDLLCLGATAAALAQLPTCHDLPPLANLTAACGCLYVLEGATLGGQLISRQLRQSLGLHAANGAAFFHSYGAQVGPMWQSFGAFVNQQARAHPDQANAMIDAARATFTALSRWLVTCQFNHSAFPVGA